MFSRFSHLLTLSLLPSEPPPSLQAADKLVGDIYGDEYRGLGLSADTVGTRRARARAHSPTHQPTHTPTHTHLGWACPPTRWQQDINTRANKCHTCRHTQTFLAYTECAHGRFLYTRAFHTPSARTRVCPHKRMCVSCALGCRVHTHSETRLHVHTLERVEQGLMYTCAFGLNTLHVHALRVQAHTQIHGGTIHTRARAHARTHTHTHTHCRWRPTSASWSARMPGDSDGVTRME